MTSAADRPSSDPAGATDGTRSAHLGLLDDGGQGRQPAVDLPRIERAVREILLAIGEDPDRDGLLATPRRVARMYEEIFAGTRARTRASTCRWCSRPTTTRW